MKLYYTPRSPFVRKVLVTAAEAGVDGRIEKVYAKTLNDSPTTDPDFLAANPMAKIPALVTGDGIVLSDSPPICEYLDSLHDGPKLLPAAGPARWHDLQLQALADGFLDAGVGLRAERRRASERQDPDMDARLVWRMGSCLDALEREAAAGRLDGPPTIGRIAAAIACEYADFRFAEQRWRDGRPNLAAWLAGFAERPAMRATRLAE